MTVRSEALRALDNHWALEAFGFERVDRVHRAANDLYVAQSVAGISVRRGSGESIPLSTIRHLADAYEVAAIEGLDDLRMGAPTDLANQAAAASFRLYELLRGLPVPENDPEFSRHVLHLAAVAYSADRWSELRGWLRGVEVSQPEPEEDQDWDQNLLHELTSVWIRLIRKDGWEDLDAVAASVTALRQIQEDRELAMFAATPPVERASKAWRLIALYHWARATEQLAQYMMQGEPTDIRSEVSYHFDRASDAALSSSDLSLDVLLRWLHTASHMMVRGSFWSMAATSASARRLVTDAARRSVFEMLPPQRIAIQEAGLLDPASAAVVVDLPTSSGKTVLAEFKIVQALEQFAPQRGWVAYVAPTRALVSQITRRLRSDLGGLGIAVEHLSSAVNVDEVESELLADAADAFDVLVTTPEKLHLAIRSDSVSRPLAMVVLDEAHNIEDKERGVRIELTLATIKRDHPSARFLLLTPFVENALDVARWLAPDSGKSISLSTSPWKPNERLIGSVSVSAPETGRGREWGLEFVPLLTSDRSIEVEGAYRLGSGPQFDRVFSQTKSNLSIIAAAGARQLSERGTSVVVAPTIDSCWNVAREIAATLPDRFDDDDDVALVRRYVGAEFGTDYALSSLLAHGVGVHHAGMSDDARALVEWLAEEGKLRALCATSTVTQGLNFPVSSIFLASRNVPQRNFSRPMTSREFWNLAGRAGRVDQQSIGVVGISSKGPEDDAAIAGFLAESAGDLASRLVELIDEIQESGKLLELESWIYRDQWADFRSYVAHMVRQASDLSNIASETERLLRNTFGYSRLEARPGSEGVRKALLDATRLYAEQLANQPGRAALADNTGFAPETVGAAIGGMTQLETRLKAGDWSPTSIFGSSGRLPDLVGVLLRMPQLRSQMEELATGSGDAGTRIAEITRDWVGGSSIAQIATKHFSDEADRTKAVSRACRAIFRTLANSATWGLSALVQLPGSGVDFDAIPEEERRQLGLIGAMVYHGVDTEGAVVMRMNDVPRSLAPSVGEAFVGTLEADEHPSVRSARQFLEGLETSDWSSHRPTGADLSGADYARVWRVLSGADTTTGE